ncbi:MAG: hypothetical protein K0Q95_1125 [Bacteroidota bacterium]|jgi:hypothetical protein|nr:hypothetical protein [Bacteroidota bacterium]
MVLFVFCSYTSHAQDTIVKNNGIVIYGKITEVTSTEISFIKKDFPDGPTFKEKKSDISLIKYRNGQSQEFVRIENNSIGQEVPAANQYNTGNYNKNVPQSSGNANNQTTPTNQNNVLANGPVNSSNNKIEEVDGKYFKNGQKLGRRGLDKELKKSTNPLVQTSLKTAKLVKISQKIVGITSIPSTIAGGVTSIITISQAVTAYQKGAITPQFYVNAGLSFLGTLTVPITSKILKKQRDKLYKKTIDLNNMSL